MISLVTGAGGFIGGHLVRRLAAGGEKVRAFTRPPRARSVLAGLDIEVVVGDLRERDSIRGALEGVDTVFHAGGLVSDWGRKEDFHAVNVGGTANLLEESAAAGVRMFVHISSIAVYGYPRAPLIDESFPYRGRGIPYVDSKIEAERLVLRFHREKGLPVVALRPTQVYGPRSPYYVTEIVEHILSGDMLLLDGGRHVAGLCYVDNLLDALLLAARTPGATGGAFNISDGSAVTWGKYVNALAAAVGRREVRRSMPSRLAWLIACLMEAAWKVAGKRNRPLLTRLAVLEMGREQNYDIGLARSVLGYEPRVQLEEGVKRIAEWLAAEREV